MPIFETDALTNLIARDIILIFFFSFLFFSFSFSAQIGEKGGKYRKRK
jgi:hypothetical protein